MDLARKLPQPSSSQLHHGHETRAHCRQEVVRKVWCAGSNAVASGPLAGASTWQCVGKQPAQLSSGAQEFTRRNNRSCARRQFTHRTHANPGAALFHAASAWPALAVVSLTTLAFLAAAFICVLVLLRPLLRQLGRQEWFRLFATLQPSSLLEIALQCNLATAAYEEARLETLAHAAELAAKSLEKASLEFEMASNVINTELPTTLDSVERASLEFEELGQSLNGLTGGLKRSKANPKQSGKASKAGSKNLNGAKEPQATASQEWKPVEALQESTANSMRKVAQDVAALTAALTPAMVAWRKRISFITERFEAVTKDERPALPAASSSESSTSGRAETWSEEWKQRQKGEDQSLEEQGQSMGDVASDLAQVATKAANVARQNLPVEAAEDTEQSAQTRRGADLLDRAAHAAVSLTGEATHLVQEAEHAIEETPLGPDEPEEGPSSSDQASDRDGAEGSNKINGRQSQNGASPVDETASAAQAVFAALSKAEEAASAAAAASGELESALQQAEQQVGGSWWGWSPVNRNSSKRGEGIEPQEHDGMAYPSSPFIAATQSQDLEEDQEPPRKKKTASSSKL